MSELSKKECIPCKGGVPPLQGSELEELYEQLKPGWKLVGEHHMEREYQFKNFREALDFTTKVGEMSEQQGHHPDIHLGWGKVKLVIYTHKIDGLTESDFIWAAKADELL